MNDLQKEKIRELRTAGVGYVRIGQMMGLSENTVKSFCRRAGLTGRGIVQQTAEDENQYCPQCGKKLAHIPGRKQKKFCSDSCRMLWWNSHREQVNHRTVREETCTCCGRTFSVAGSAARKYCSHECCGRPGKHTGCYGL